MAKETYYFSHDFEPLSDPKLGALVAQYGALGYGVFWRLIEILHSQDSHRIEKKPYIFLSLAQQMSTPVEQMKEIIDFAVNDCELFESDENGFWSNRVLRNIGQRKHISEQKSKAGKASAERRAEQRSTGVQQNPTKERKGKEKKGNQIKLDEVSFSDLKLPFDSIQFQDAWKTLLKQPKWKKKTSDALKVSLKKLSEVSEPDAIRMIQNSIEGSWQGLFPLKPNAKPNQQDDRLFGNVTKSGFQKTLNELKAIDDAELEQKRIEANRSLEG